MDTIFIVILSLLFSAFFSGMEIAFVSANKLRFELDKQSKNLSITFLNQLFKNPQQFISTILVGNNIALVVYGLEIANLFEIPLSKISHNVALVTIIETVIATTIVLFTSEFLPKTIFRINPNLWLKIFAFPAWLFYILLYPISVFITRLSISILRIFGIKNTHTNNEYILNRNDLDYWVQESIENKAENEELENEVKIFQNALDFSSVKLRDCMVPRTEIEALSIETPTEVLKAKFIETRLSKIIIYKDTIDDIIGYIHLSEMFTNPQKWKDNIKPLPIAPEIMPANKLLEMLMKQKRTMAVVVDEFGGTAGIVTMEDIMEEIFGEIEDEHDSNDLISKKISDNEFILSGRLEIDTVNQQYGLDLVESDSYVTIAGYILYHHEDFPKLNEILKIDNYSIKILQVTNNKIGLINLRKIGN